MSKIVFRGKTYHSVFEMPNDVREAYQIEKRRRPESNDSKSLTDIVDMSDEIRELYERAVGTVKERPASARPLNELPNTEDLYRQSAAASRRSREMSADTTQEPVIEEDNGLGRLALTVFLILLISAIGFFLLQAMN